jgi:restriction system protein
MLYLAIIFIALIAVVLLTPFRHRIHGLISDIREAQASARLKRERDRLERQKKEEQAAAERKRREREAREREKESALFFLGKMRSLIAEHKSALAYERRMCTQSDSYGNLDLSAWTDNNGLVGVAYMNGLEEPALLNSLIASPTLVTSGYLYFWKSVIVPRLGGVESFLNGWQMCRRTLPEFSKYSNWPAFILEEIDQAVHGASDQESDVTLSSQEIGIQYEMHCEAILTQAFWHVSRTSTTGDHGVDLIATHQSGPRVCIQCKYSSNPVGNTAVQEVAAGRAHYSGTHAVVVSHSGFTKSAKELALSNRVILLATEDLLYLFDRLN